MIRQTLTIQTGNNLVADLLIHQTFFHQMLKKSRFTKLPPPPPPNFPAIQIGRMLCAYPIEHMALFQVDTSLRI